MRLEPLHDIFQRLLRNELKVSPYGLFFPKPKVLSIRQGLFALERVNHRGRTRVVSRSPYTLMHTKSL